MVHDQEADEHRDVDVTVLVPDPDGQLRGLLAFEAKDEGRPLDVTKLEQLGAKLEDMPAVVHKSVVSTSGYTKGAVRKAAAKKITLYTVKPWLTPMQDDIGPEGFPGTPQESLFVSNTLLIWLPGWAIQFRFPDIDPSVQFSLSDTAPILTPGGEPHARFLRLADLMEEVLGRSTDGLISRPDVLAVLPTPGPPTNDEPNGLIGPAMTCRDAVDIRDLGCALEVEGLGLRKADSAVVVGTIQWTTERIKPDFFIMREWSTEMVFAAGAIAIMPGWHPTILAMVFGVGSRDVAIHRTAFTERHLQQFRALRLK